jgi:hypothetical protein
MRLSSPVGLAWLVFAALGCAVACGDDDDSTGGGTSGSANQGGENSAGTKSNAAGTAGKAGASMASAGEGGGPAVVDSQLCTDLGGPKGIDAVVRGDGKMSDADPFNAFKFEKDGRQASVLLNVATDPCIGQQFASLLTAGRADDLEHLAQCLSLFVQNAAGCAVAYDEDDSGRVCKDMKSAHVGLSITEEDYTALIIDAATALIAAGVAQDSPQFMAVAGALTAEELKQDIITNDAPSYSQPGAMCEPSGAAGAGGMSSDGGAGGSGGQP